MSGVKDLMAKVDRRIFRSKIVSAIADFGVVDDVEGAFFDQPREVNLPIGGVMSLALSFECQYREEFAALEQGMLVTIDGVRYRFLRELLPGGGDESGLTVIELGEVL